jgi:hypothetical protein
MILMKQLFICAKKAPERVSSQKSLKIFQYKAMKQKESMKNSTFAGAAFFIRCITMNQKLRYAKENLSIFEYKLI